MEAKSDLLVAINSITPQGRDFPRNEVDLMDHISANEIQSFHDNCYVLEKSQIIK